MNYCNTIWTEDELTVLHETASTTYVTKLTIPLRWSVIEDNLYGGYQLRSDEAGITAWAKIEVDDGVHTPVTDEKSQGNSWDEKTFNLDISGLTGQLTIKLYLKRAVNGAGNAELKGLSLSLFAEEII